MKQFVRRQRRTSTSATRKETIEMPILQKHVNTLLECMSSQHCAPRSYISVCRRWWCSNNKTDEFRTNGEEKRKSAILNTQHNVRRHMSACVCSESANNVNCFYIKNSEKTVVSVRERWWNRKNKVIIHRLRKFTRHFNLFLNLNEEKSKAHTCNLFDFSLSL